MMLHLYKLLALLILKVRVNTTLAIKSKMLGKLPVAWSIDRVHGANSPFYITEHVGLGNVRIDNDSYGQRGNRDHNSNAATLIDEPSWDKENVFHVESCAVCRSGNNVGQVYGCATWGYTATSEGKVTLMPRSFRSMPSDQFKEANEAWNKWGEEKKGSRFEKAPTLKSPDQDEN